ncbi:hypothetical protein NE237_006297 [Protea cynaroides]|uniref:Uncharacterized protein n=1 Tax=Protea cynaroides TaxID=273540 RepID=A0A9Q0QV63_9MAGN|nr:hypothetical protein NE237_006297 [Protea cynaroides]
MFHIPSTKFMIEDTISDKSEQKIGNVEISNIETVHSNEAWNGENENPDDDVDIPLVAEETRPDKSEQEAGKLEENFSSELEEKSRETIDSKEEMTDEKPVEYELQDSECLKSPLVTLATEGSYFQEQDEPEKTEDTSETESANIGKDKCNEAKPQDKILETAERTISEKAKDDENTETKLYVSSIKDGEGLERESKKLLLPLTNSSIEENEDKKGSSVIEPTENIEVTEIIEAEENCIWEIPKDVEASIQSFPTDEPEEEKLEKSLDVVPEAVEPATSHAEAQRSTSEKEEKSIKTIEENFNEESKEGKINWDDEGRGQGRQKDENPTEVDQSQKIDTMEIENPNMKTGSVLVAHSLSKGTIQEACEQQEDVSNIEVEEQVHDENRNAPVEDNNIEEEFKATQKMESTIFEQGKTIDGAQKLELISQVSGMEVQETVKVCELDSKEKSPENYVSQKIEEQNEKNEENSEIVIGKTLTEGEVERLIIEEDRTIPVQEIVLFGNQTDGQNSEVEEKNEGPEFNGEEQDCKTNDTDKATKNEIINKEVSAEPKVAAVEEDTEKHIMEESTDMVHPTESIREPLEEISQEGEFKKQHEEEVHKGPDRECEVLEKFSTGVNTESQKLVENRAVNDHSAPSIQEETVIGSCQEDEVSEGLEGTSVGEKTEKAILEEYGAVTDTCTFSVVRETVKERSEEDEKDAEKLKEDVKFTDHKVGTLKNIEDTNKNVDASGDTETSREEILQKEHSQKFAVNEEQMEEDLEEPKNNNERSEVASARTSQQAEQEGELLVDGSNLASEEKSPIATETSWTSLQHLDVKGVKLEETTIQSDNAENMLKVEKQDADEGNQEIDSEMKAEVSDTIAGFEYKGIETTTGKEITTTETPFDNRWEETLQGSSMLAPERQELDSIEESKELKDETSMQDKNLEIPNLAKSTVEISIQEEYPWKHEDVSKMGTDKIGKENLNEVLNENDSARENKLPDSYPEKNIAELKEAEEINKEESTELTKLRENSRTEILKEEEKQQESSDEVEFDGEKPFDAVSKGVESLETNSSCANIEQDVLDQEDPIKNLDEIPEGDGIGSEKIENVGILLEAGDQSHERNEGFDPTDNRALQESIENVDPNQKPEREYETVAEHQSHETLPGAKENRIKEYNRDVEDHNTISIEYQMAMKRLQEEEKDSMNLEDIGLKVEAELQTGKKDIPDEATKTAIFIEIARNGHDKAERSQNISKWSVEEESNAKDLHKVSIADGIVNEVHYTALLPVEKCNEEIYNDVKTEKLNLKTLEFPNKRLEASPITEPSEGDVTQRQTSEDIANISKSVPEISEEMIQEDIFKEAVKSNDQLSIASNAAITEQVTSQESEPEGGKLVWESNIGSEEKCQGTVETGSMGEEVKEVKLDQNSDSWIQLPSEGENMHKESQKLEKIGASEIEAEIKRSSDAVAESEYQVVKAITEADTTANRPPLVEESEENLQKTPVPGFEQELGSRTTNKKIRDEMPKADEPLGENNSVGLFTPEETEDVCRQREEHMDLEQASKMGFQDIKKGSPNEQEEKDEKPDEACKLYCETTASASKDDDSFQEREKNTKLNEACDFGRTETPREEEYEILVSQKEESEGIKFEIPFNEAEIPRFISEEQEAEPPSSINKIDMSKIKDEAGKDLDASPTPKSPAEEVPEEEAVNQPKGVTQLLPKELIHGTNETNEENREGAAEDKNVVKGPIEVQKHNNTSTNLVCNPGNIMGDLHPTDQEVPTNDSNALSLINASQEQAPEKRSQITEDDEGHALEFANQATGEVNLPKGATEGDPAKDEVVVKEISNKECEKMNNYRCVQENMAAFSYVEQAIAERNFRDNPNEHDTTTNVVIEDHNHYPPCVGEETAKNVHQENDMEEKVGEIAPTLEVENKSQALGAIEDQEEKKKVANETSEILNEDVSEGLEKACASATIEETRMAKDPCLVSIQEQTNTESQYKVEKEGKKANDTKIKLDLADQTRGLDEEDLQYKANEVKSSEVVLVEQQPVTLPSTNEVDAMTIKDEADKDLDISPTSNSPAEEAPKEEVVNKPKEIMQLVPKEMSHGINETNENNKGAAEDKNVSKEINKVQNPNDTSSNLASNLGDIVEDLHLKDQEVPISISASSAMETSNEHVPEKEGHMTEDEDRHGLAIVEQANSEVNQPREETEGDPIKDEVQAEEILYKGGEKMNHYNNVQEKTSRNEGGETPVREQEDMIVFSSVDHATREQSIKDSPKDHDTTSNLVIEEQSLVKEPNVECVGEETVKRTRQDEKKRKKVDETETNLEAKDNCQASGDIEDQMEKITEINDIPKCEILNEEVPEGLEKDVTTENIEKQKMEENRTTKDLCLVSIGEETCKENHHEDKKEGNKINDVEIKLHLDDQSQEELSGGDLGDKANETNKTTNCQTLNDEVSQGTENDGSSEKTDKQIIEDKAIKETFLAAIEEETTKKAHQGEETDEPEVEKEAINLEPKDQNHETSSQNNATEDHILNEEVKSSHFVPVDHDLETTPSTDEKMDIMTMKEDNAVSSTPNTPAKEAPETEAVNEPQEVPHHEPPELIDESIITNEENTESATEAKIVAEEFIEVGKLKTTSSDLASNPSNIGEDLHPKDQEVPPNKFNASSVNEVSQEKTPKKEGNMTEDEERNSWVLIKQETDETSLETGEMEVYIINNEAPAQEILKKEAEKMNDTDANIANGGREIPMPEHQQRAIFSSIDQAIAESSIRDSPDVPDTTSNLVFDKQSQVKTSLMHEVQIHENEKTKGTNLEDSDSLNEKLSHLSDAQPSNKELPQKVDTVKLPEVTEISQNIEKLERALDATREESTQKKISTEQKDISSVPQHSIGKSLQEDEVQDQRDGKALGTKSKEKGVEYGGDSTLEDVTEEPKLLDTGMVSLCDLLKSTKDSSHMVAGNTDSAPPANKGDLQYKEQQIIQGEKDKIMEEETDDGQEEENYHKEMHSGSNLPVLLEVPRNADVKPTHKKSHKILSGVGSKVKYSIAKIKNVISCTHPPPEATFTKLRK